MAMQGGLVMQFPSMKVEESAEHMREGPILVICRENNWHPRAFQKPNTCLSCEDVPQQQHTPQNPLSGVCKGWCIQSYSYLIKMFLGFSMVQSTCSLTELYRHKQGWI